MENAKTTKATKPTKPTKKADEVQALKDEVARLQQRLTDKDKETAAIEQELEQRRDHLQFMVNGLNADKDRLESMLAEQTAKNVRLKNENSYLLEQLDGKHYTFRQRLSILFTGKA